MADFEHKGVEYNQMVRRLSKPGEDIIATLTPLRAHMWHMATGVSGEAGELSDAIKKGCIYNKEIDVANIKEELGDLEFFMEGVRQAFNITREETLAHNIEKLVTGSEKGKARYEAGQYTDKAAQERADKVA